MSLIVRNNNRVSKRTRKNSIARSFGKLVNNVPVVGNIYGAARGAWKTGKSMYNSFAPERTTVRSATSTGYIAPKKYYGGTNGTYKGKFRKPRYVKKTTNEKLLGTGYGKVVETKGDCRGTDAVYVGHTTFYLDAIAEVVSVAILRKLFKKAGYEISEAGTKLSLASVTSDGSSVGFTTTILLEDGNGNTTTYDYDLGATDTLVNVAVNSALKGYIIGFAEGNETKIVKKIFLFGTTRTTLLASLELINEVVSLKMTSKMVLQNRTKAASATSEVFETERVDNQPLSGKSFLFKKSTPFVNHVGPAAAAPDMNSLFEKWVYNKGGVHIFSDDSAGFDPKLKQIPLKSYFNNCKGVSSVKLDPGFVKTSRLSNNINMYFENFVRHLAWYTGTGTRAQKVGDCCLFGFEEMLDSGSANKIILQFECEYGVYGTLKTGRATAANPGFLTINY